MPAADSVLMASGAKRHFGPQVISGIDASSPTAIPGDGLVSVPAVWRIDRANVFRPTRSATEVSVDTVDGGTASAVLCSMPFYDEERLIPRGKLVDIPDVR